MKGAGRLKGFGDRALYSWMRLPSRTRLALVIFLLCLVAYTLIMILVPRYQGSPTTQGDEPHYLLITESIIRDGDLHLYNNYSEEQYLPYFEQDIVMWHVTEDASGKYVSTHPMALSVLVLPMFWLFGYGGAAFTMIVLTALAAALTFAVTDRFARRKIAAGVTLFAFLTYPLILYSRLIYPETVTVFLVALGTWSAWRLKESGRWVYGNVMGLVSGLVVLFHPKFVAISIAFFILFLVTTPSRDLKGLARFLASAALPFALLLVFTGVTYGPNLLKGLTASGGSKFVGGYWGTNSVWGIPGMFIDRAWGLFIFAPLYILFPHGMFLQNNRLEWERWWVFFPVCIGLHAVFLGTFQSWNGGAAPVQRYLVPLVPLFIVCVAVFLDRCRSAVAYGFAAVFALLQIVTTVWGFRFIVGTFGMENLDNIFLVHFLGENPVKRLLMFIFPLFHPSSPKAVLLTLAWILAYVLTVYAARRYYMRHGGGRLSPIIDIRPWGFVKPA